MKAALVFFAVSLVNAAAGAQFTRINGLLCVRSEFVETHAESDSRVECAALCDSTRRCQAFSMANGPCQLFLFDKCSKYVRDCTCSKRGQVFVKQQQGLPPGVLCPSAFENDSCGTKYKAYSAITNWDSAKSAIDLESGLVIMADVTDWTEMTYLNSYFSQKNMADVFLGGRQTTGSAEPAGGWLWVSCQTSINSSLWRANEPSNAGGTECVTMGGSNVNALNDGNLALPNPPRYSLAECVSPFD